MNILILSWRGPKHPNSGGAEIATMEHAKAWVKKGHSVTLFTSSFKDAKRTEILDGVNIIRFGNQFLSVHFLAFIWYIFETHQKFDIVIDQFHGIPFFAPIYVKTKVIAYIHETAIEVWGRNELKKPFNIIPAIVGPVFEPLVFKLYKDIDFITVSDSTQNDLIAFGIKRFRIHVVQNGITKVKVKEQKRGKLLTYLGALAKDKGVEDAINVLAEVLRKDTGWEMRILGKGDNNYLKILKYKARKLGVEQSLKFEGYVTEKKKFETLARSFCLVNPSIHEGWGLVNIEANAVGTPVFAYKVKGISDSVIDGKTGMLFEKGDYRQMALEIIKLSQNKDKYESISKYCKRSSEKFSWERSTAESTLLIESL